MTWVQKRHFVSMLEELVNKVGGERWGMGLILKGENCRMKNFLIMAASLFTSIPVACAACLSYAINESISWAVIHGACNCFYIFYYLFSVKGYLIK